MTDCIQRALLERDQYIELFQQWGFPQAEAVALTRLEVLVDEYPQALLAIATTSPGRMGLNEWSAIRNQFPGFEVDYNNAMSGQPTQRDFAGGDFCSVERVDLCLVCAQQVLAGMTYDTTLNKFVYE